MSELKQRQMSLYKMGRVAEDDELMGIIAYKTGGYADVRDPAWKHDVHGYLDRRVEKFAKEERARGGYKPLRTENAHPGQNNTDWVRMAVDAYWMEVNTEGWGYYVGNYWSHAILKPSWLDVHLVVAQHRHYPDLSWDLWEYMAMALAIGGEWEALVYE